MYELPTVIKVGDKTFKIRNKGDYRVILDCFSAIQDVELAEDERYISALIIFYQDINCYADLLYFSENEIKELIEQMFNFFNCGQKSIGATKPHKLIDWENDAQMICAAINKVANVEIRAINYCHWWTFMGYYTSIGESVLSTVVGIREKVIKGTKLEKYEKEFKRDNPQYFSFDYRTREQKEEDEKIRKMFGGK